MAAKKRKATASTRKSSKKQDGKKRDSLIDLAREQLKEIRNSDQAQEIRSAYQQIWHAGLGAYAQSADAISDVADAALESSESGEKIFKKLVKDGAKLEKKARNELDELRDKAEDRFEKAGKRVSKLESAFDKRVQKAINRLMVPSKADIDSLEAKIDKLQRTLEGKPAKRPAKRKATPKKKAASKKSPTKRKTAAKPKSKAKKQTKKKKSPAKKRVVAKKKAAPKKRAPAKKKAARRR